MKTTDFFHNAKMAIKGEKTAKVIACIKVRSNEYAIIY